MNAFPNRMRRHFLVLPFGPFVTCAILSCCIRIGYEKLASWSDAKAPAGSLYWYANGHDGMYNFFVGYFPVAVFATACLCIMASLSHRIRLGRLNDEIGIKRMGLLLMLIAASAVLCMFTVAVAHFD